MRASCFVSPRPSGERRASRHSEYVGRTLPAGSRLNGFGSDRARPNDVGEVRRVLNSFLPFVEAEELLRNALNVFTLTADDWADVRRACDALSYAEITRACTEAAKATILRDRIWASTAWSHGTSFGFTSVRKRVTSRRRAPAGHPELDRESRRFFPGHSGRNERSAETEIRQGRRNLPIPSLIPLPLDNTLNTTHIYMF